MDRGNGPGGTGRRVSIWILRLAVPAVGIFLLSSCGGARDGSDVRVEVVGRETHVYSSETPVWGSEARPFTLVEVLGAGGADEGPIFGQPVTVTTDEVGIRYVLDRHAQTVVVLAPDGSGTRVIGKGGEGPGEFQAPSDMTLLPEGRLAVLDPGAFRITVFRRNGTFEKQFRIPEYLSQFEVRTDGSILAYPRGRVFTLRTLGSELNRDAAQVLVLTPDGQALASLSPRRDLQHPDFSPLINMVFMASLPGDSLLLSFLSQDVVELWSPDGTLVRVMHRPAPFGPEPPRSGEEDRGPALAPFRGTEFDILSSGLAADPLGDFWAVLVPMARARFRTPMFGEPEIPAEWAIDLFDRAGRWLARQPLDFAAPQAVLDWGSDGLYLLNLEGDAAVYRFQLRTRGTFDGRAEAETKATDLIQ